MSRLFQNRLRCRTIESVIFPTVLRHDFFFFKLCLSFGPSPDFRCRQWWSPYTEYSRSRRGLNVRVSPRGRSGTRLSRVRTMRTHRMRPVGPRPYARVPGIAIIIAITISGICGRQNTAYVFLNVKKPG